MNRKKFLQQSMLAVGGLAVGAHKAKALTPADTVLGQGQKRYRLNQQWSQADAGRNPVKDCHEMVQDAKGRIILLTNETKNNVLIYDKSGKVLQNWGTEYPGAHGLSLFSEGGEDRLFICDNNRSQVIKTTVEGRVLLTLDYPKETGMYTKAEEFIPTETAIAPNGDIYVVDGYGKDFVIQYDARGRYIRHFGGRGTEPYHLRNAHGICIDTRKGTPQLVVTSREENAFKRFTLDGQYLGTIAMPGAWVCRPVIRGQYLYAAVLQSSSMLWQQSGFVTILDENDRVVSNLGGSAPEYVDGKLQDMRQTSKLFCYPHDVCIDNDECLYVAQWNSGKVYPYKLEPIA
jgi:hypothetical protein